MKISARTLNIMTEMNLTPDEMRDILIAYLSSIMAFGTKIEYAEGKVAFCGFDGRGVSLDITGKDGSAMPFEWLKSHPEQAGEIINVLSESGIPDDEAIAEIINGLKHYAMAGGSAFTCVSSGSAIPSEEESDFIDEDDDGLDEDFIEMAMAEELLRCALADYPMVPKHEVEKYLANLIFTLLLPGRQFVASSASLEQLVKAGIVDRSFRGLVGKSAIGRHHRFIIAGSQVTSDVAQEPELLLMPGSAGLSQITQKSFDYDGWVFDRDLLKIDHLDMIIRAMQLIDTGPDDAICVRK